MQWKPKLKFGASVCMKRVGLCGISTNMSQEKPIKKTTAKVVFGTGLLLLQNQHTLRPVAKGRYKCQALLDEKAILSCMMCVDLNPIRAKMHNKIETSKYTSIKKRCEQAKKTNQPNKLNNQVNTLLNFAGKPKKDMPKGIPCELTTYIELIDWTGKTRYITIPMYL